MRKLCIPMWDVAYRVKRGSRLRLDISSSDFPQYAVHSNFPGIWSEQERIQKARQTVLSGKEFPSRIVLPAEKRSS